jgi:hypothetical protein
MGGNSACLSAPDLCLLDLVLSDFFSFPFLPLTPDDGTLKLPFHLKELCVQGNQPMLLHKRLKIIYMKPVQIKVL